jgi:hypothetical protein
MGLAEKCGSLDLYLSPRNIAGHSMYIKSRESIAISVPVSTLHDVISQTDTNDSGLLLKIDCEGCEHPVLSSLTQQMADRISCIIFEPQLSCYDLSTLLENLRGLGFQISKFGYLFVAFKEVTAANGNGAMASQAALQM